MRVRVLAEALLALTVLVGASGSATAELQIDITRGVIEPLPIAITDLYGVTERERQIGGDIAGVITANLQRSGLFRPVPPAAFIQDLASLQNGPNYGEWTIIDSEALVAGSVETQPDGRIRVDYRLYDVFGTQQMSANAWFVTEDAWRRVAHIISDDIYRAITGEEGYFDSRIVYISETGPGTARVKRLAVMDQDGANHQMLTNGDSLVLTPRFSPLRNEITYLAYYNDRPRVFLYNIDTGSQEPLGDFPGMSFAPRFSPDGNRVIMSLASGGNTDIHTMDLRTREVRRLTTDPSIETSASYSPDGRQIVFESDRGGSQQLYVMDADGSNARRISFGEGRYASPVWSPRGDLIAFTRLFQGRFYIGVMRPDGTGERMLADAFHVEGPTWAPNGRVLMYFSETPSGPGGTSKISRLFAVDLSGRNQWPVETPVDGSDPAWGPLN
ncbi:MAG: Tol-Pal system beta propeller repeat protein TolB [Inquilinaceae bacterium]